ncbi:MAG: tRNA epoxyqueuosine(34) reductase QueG [Bacteroides sp.]|nr:tRNA epoxyqueuosine(34) reductase QueG [Bacteroides sp.]
MLDPTELKAELKTAGVFKSGIASVTEVPASVTDAYHRWLSEGRHGGMGYLENHLELRSNPSLLLPGAKSVVCCAFNYYFGHHDGPLQWAGYALGDDYHEVVRNRLNVVARWITDTTGAQCRVCVDTAPLHERYWAVQSGVGFIGLNRQLIIPGAGTHFFLGEILTTAEFMPDEPCTDSCMGCGKCIECCPGKALSSEGMDANRCLSYLTIEHRGDLPPDTSLGRHIYGCDVCQDVCPHNSNPPVSDIEEFRPRKPILELDTETILAMKQEDFSTLFRHSAIKRTKLTGLQRNALTIKRQKGTQGHKKQNNKGT